MYTVVKEALKKSEKIHIVFFYVGDSKHSRSGSQIDEGEVQTLFNNWRNHPYVEFIYGEFVYVEFVYVEFVYAEFAYVQFIYVEFVYVGYKWL